MARISKCDKLPEHERLRLVGMIGEGVSWRDLSAAFGISSATIHEWSARNGFGRSATESKRKQFDYLLTKPDGEQTGQQTGQRTESTGNPDTDAAAERDANVARSAAGVAVAIIRRLADLVEACPEAKDTGVIATALDKAWGTYARINKLDDAKPEVANDHTAMAEMVRRKLGI